MSRTAGPPEYTPVVVDVPEQAAVAHPDSSCGPSEVFARTASRPGPDLGIRLPGRPDGLETQAVARLVDGSLPGIYDGERGLRHG